MIIKKNSGVGLATNAFSISENQILVDALNKNFGFNCKIVSDHGLPTIYIPKSNLTNLQDITLAYMHPTLLYKIHL